MTLADLFHTIVNTPLLTIGMWILIGWVALVALIFLYAVCSSFSD